MDAVVSVIVKHPAKVDGVRFDQGPAKVTEAQALMLEAEGLIERPSSEDGAIAALFVPHDAALFEAQVEARAQLMARDLADAAVGGMELVCEERLRSLQAVHDVALARLAESEESRQALQAVHGQTLARLAELEARLAATPHDTERPDGAGEPPEGASDAPGPAGEAGASPATKDQGSRRAAPRKG